MASTRSNKLTDELSAALEKGVDVKGRRVFLHGNVEEDSIAVAIRGMYLMSEMSGKPIELVVTSYGGDLDEAFALHDVTRTIKVPVHTVALGKCMSAAPLLVACGQRGQRYASENCLFMLHDVEVEETPGSPAQLISAAEAAREQMRNYARLLAKYTLRKADHWGRMFRSKTDRYFTADDALEWGLIDQIWSEKE